MIASQSPIPVLLAALLLFVESAAAQLTIPLPAGKPDATADDAVVAADSRLDPLAWLAGCWLGSVNMREFREHWMPLRGNLLVGTSQTTLQGKTLEFEYLRIEPRTDGVYYVATPAKQKEQAFKLDKIQKEGDDTVFVFSNPAHDFPQRIVYRRGGKGWLYAHVEGKVNGVESRVIYPMRRIGCESGALIEQ